LPNLTFLHAAVATLPKCRVVIAAPAQRFASPCAHRPEQEATRSETVTEKTIIRAGLDGERKRRVAAAAPGNRCESSPPASRRRCRSALVVLVVTMSLSAGGVANAQSSSVEVRRATTASAHTKDQRKVARRLVRKMVAARTPSTRERAVLNIFRALRVTVVDARGRAVVRGFARSSRDPMLYDFEVRHMAARWGTGYSQNVKTLAAALRAPAFRLNGKAISTKQFENGLRAVSVMARRRPRDVRSLPLLLVRELGLSRKRKSDLAVSMPVKRMKLDPVQQALILMNLSAAFRAYSPARAGARASQAVGDGCQVFGDWTGKNLSPWGKWSTGFAKVILDNFKFAGKYESLVDLAKSASKGAQTLAAISDIVHAFVMAGGIDFEIVGAHTQGTHYGPAEADHPKAAEKPGQQMKFTIKLTSAFPEKESFVVKCGPLVNFKLPAEGAIPDIEVHWDRMNVGSYADLETRGTIEAETRTKANGTASLTFTPHDERFPGLGRVTSQRGTLHPSVDLYTGMQNAPGMPSDWVGLRSKTFNYTVERHEPFIYEGRVRELL
jgi:hypothetical protein